MAIAVNSPGLPVVGWFLILPVGWIFVIVLAIMGVLNASRGEMKPLPVIGGAELIK